MKPGTKRLTTTGVKRKWRLLRNWAEKELEPLAGQEGTAELQRAIETLDILLSQKDGCDCPVWGHHAITCRRSFA